jgi:hypothetical protein
VVHVLLLDQLDFDPRDAGASALSVFFVGVPALGTVLIVAHLAERVWGGRGPQRGTVS